MGVSKRWIRCRKCEPCVRDPCGTCGNCLDSPRFGGPNVRKQACKIKKCANPTRNGGAAEEEEKKSKKPVGRAVSVKNEEYFQNIQKIIPKSALPPPGPSSPLKRFENTSVNVSKVTETDESGDGKEEVNNSSNNTNDIIRPDNSDSAKHSDNTNNINHSIENINNPMQSPNPIDSTNQPVNNTNHPVKSTYHPINNTNHPINNTNTNINNSNHIMNNPMIKANQPNFMDVSKVGGYYKPPSTPAKGPAYPPAPVPNQRYHLPRPAFPQTPAKGPVYPHTGTPGPAYPRPPTNQFYPNSMPPLRHATTPFNYNNSARPPFNPARYFTPRKPMKRFLPPPSNPNPPMQTNALNLPTSSAFKNPLSGTTPTSNLLTEPMNLMKRRKIEETQRAFSNIPVVNTHDKGFLEMVNGDDVINVDKMYNVTDGIVDDGGLGADDITLEENDSEDTAALLKNSTESPTVPNTVDESDDLDEKNLIRFLEKDDIIASFITIFEEANEEEKLSLFDRLLEPVGAAVQDSMMTHLFKTVQKRKHEKYEVKITEKVASEVLQKAKPPSGPPGPPSAPPIPVPPGPKGPPGPLPQVARKSTSNSRPKAAMSLLVCDCRVYRTTNQEKLKNHIEAVHGGVTYHEWQTCGECDHRFKFWDDLKVHIGIKH